MARKNQRKNPKALDDLNYYETTGSVNAKPTEADTIVDKSMDAVSQNMLKKDVKPYESQQ